MLKMLLMKHFHKILHIANHKHITIIFYSLVK